VFGRGAVIIAEPFAKLEEGTSELMIDDILRSTTNLYNQVGHGLPAMGTMGNSFNPDVPTVLILSPVIAFELHARRRLRDRRIGWDAILALALRIHFSLPRRCGAPCIARATWRGCCPGED
jgi:hypothetical protein